jgi:hypothetical protein
MLYGIPRKHQGENHNITLWDFKAGMRPVSFWEIAPTYYVMQAERLRFLSELESSLTHMAVSLGRHCTDPWPNNHIGQVRGQSDPASSSVVHAYGIM